MKKLLIIIVFLIISVFSFSQEIYDIKINNLILVILFFSERFKRERLFRVVFCRR